VTIRFVTSFHLAQLWRYGKGRRKGRGRKRGRKRKKEKRKGDEKGEEEREEKGKEKKKGKGEGKGKERVARCDHAFILHRYGDMKPQMLDGRTNAWTDARVILYSVQCQLDLGRAERPKIRSRNCESKCRKQQIISSQSTCASWTSKKHLIPFRIKNYG